MKKKVLIPVVIILIVAIVVFSAGCIDLENGERAQMLDSQSTPTIEQSNEREIFLGYLEEVNDPNNIQWIYCCSYDGKVLFKSAVMGKTLSATKSTEPYERVSYDGHSSEEYYAGQEFAGYVPGTAELMNPSGMYGHDTPGVIWMDPQGNYYEWHGGPYFVSSVPLKFETPVISYQNVDFDVYQLALLAEEKLRNGIPLTNEEMLCLNS
ncbi:MAG: hypothetical protein PHG24_01310 [Candidatus Pacebacteria bacterium]|nr:hypothetical protein [Methanobacteriaceae archaeon]MDD4661903.1 hypothetical protein [Candidatus Paceibacterota bacterium]